MSKALYPLGGLRFWSESEIELREQFQSRIVGVVTRTLVGLNRAWLVERVEGPSLIPRFRVNPAYDTDDVFYTNHVAASEPLCLRAETTDSTYIAMRNSGLKLPLCMWQAGKSFRRETNDGASAAKMRYNEFWQLEFQCAYSSESKCDYRSHLIQAVCPEVQRTTGRDTLVVESDRLPPYSRSTIDIECVLPKRHIEIASCSLRTDYGPNVEVCEIAIGLDRVVEIAHGGGQ